MITPPEIKPPYKGLIPYSEEDAEFFFGREREQNFITSNLLAERLTLLHGASGVGKSSVLRAGVEHHLRVLAKENLETLGKPKYVVVFFNDWREEDPLRSLLAKVRQSVELTLGGEKIDSVAPSLPFTESLLEWSKLVRGHLLIVLDQFEEYFLYHQDDDGEGTFAVEFPRAVKSLGLPANFLVSFREDAFAKLTFFKVRMPEVFGNYLALDHLDEHAGRDAIVKPIEQYNKKFANGKPPISIEQALVDEVLKQVETGQVTVGEAGRGILKKETTTKQIETPFLQMVMMRLWEEEMTEGSNLLRLATLERLADKETNETGAERIVRTHLDKTMASLSEERQNIATEVFHYLVTPSGTKIAHTVDDLVGYSHVPKTKLAPALEELAAGVMRILRGVSSPADKKGEPRYEIFHDVLAAPILDWRTRRVRAREQLEAARKADEQLREAEKQAREEEKSKFAKRRRWAIAILLTLLFVAAAAVLWGMLNRQRAAAAEAQRAADAQKAAEKEREQAKEQARLLSLKAEELETAKNQAEEEKEVAEDQTKLAIANEKKAKSEKARAVKYLNTSTDLLEGDMEAADKHYQEVLEVTGCDLKEGLKDNLKEYEILYRRYEALGAEAQKGIVRGKINSVRAKINTTPCP